MKDNLVSEEIHVSKSRFSGTQIFQMFYPKIIKSLNDQLQVLAEIWRFYDFEETGGEVLFPPQSCMYASSGFK